MLGHLVVGLFAAIGVALSVAYTLVSTDLGRDLIVPRVLRIADDALAGRIELRSFQLLSGGGIELVGVRVVDPDEEEVLRADRLIVYPDLARLRSRAIGFRAQIDGPAVVLRREAD